MGSGDFSQMVKFGITCRDLLHAGPFGLTAKPKINLSRPATASSEKAMYNSMVYAPGVEIHM